MDQIGIDLGKKRSDVCVMSAVTTVSERFKCDTTRATLTERFARRPTAQIAIEACRSSGWVHELLTGLGHTVVVVDTSRVRQIGVGQGRRKTDRRDAEALARSLWTGTTPRAHVLRYETQKLRDVLHTRAQLVGQRASLVTMVRGQWQGQGEELGGCASAAFAAKVRASGSALVTAPQVQAVLAVLDVVNEQIAGLTEQLERLAEQQEAYARLCTVPGVKLIVGLSFIAALDEATRFRHAREVAAYLGLVPSEASTGGKVRRGGITKAGNSMARQALVQAAQSLLRSPKRQQDPLVVWGQQVIARRGKRQGVVAVARRLARILWALWCDGSDYDPQGLGRASASGLTRRARRAQAEAAQMAALRYQA